MIFSIIRVLDPLFLDLKDSTCPIYVRSSQANNIEKYLYM